MKVEVYFIAENSHEKQELISTLNPVIAEAHYFNLCKTKTSINGQIIVRSHNGINLCGEYITGKHDSNLPRERNVHRYKMIWANNNEWIKPCPIQIRGLAMACCGNQHGYQTKFARLLGIEARTWRHWVKLINNKKQMPWYAWYAALNLFFHSIDLNLAAQRPAELLLNN